MICYPDDFMSISKKIIPRDLIIQFLSIFWFPLCVFLLHIFLSRGLQFYILVPWIDIPMHYLGGLSMAYSMFLSLAFLKKEGIITPLNSIIELTLTFTLVATIAVFWEFAEFSMDQLIGTNVQISLQNTMQDLFIGILGASTMIGYKIIQKSK